MPVFKCKMCGGDLEIKEGMSVAECQYCGTQQTLPRLDSERRANLYDRANHFRRNNEYDKAMALYEQILNEEPTDAEAYWSLVLCRYGVEYVEDPATHKRVPTVNRTQYTSIFADEDYKQAIAHADGAQRAVYEAQAKDIDDIQKGILEISSKEEPFDVFICYKETDASGRRTPDSVLAAELYHELKQEGFKVFFSRITLEDKLGSAYEPYIFAALNSAKVMVVIGTKPEYFNAVWVKNEWSRYLALIKSGAKKVLIPAYRDMDPYDLPEEFSHLQAQDMSKLGFMQDLIRGIKKLTETDEPKAAGKETVVMGAGGANIAPLLKRAFMFLEDGDWQSANEYCEKVLDMDPENAQAYLGKLMAELQVRKKEELVNCAYSFDHTANYQRVMQFGDDKLKIEMQGYISQINQRNEQARLEQLYSNAVTAMQAAKTEEDFKAAAAAFQAISEFKDSEHLAARCLDQAQNAKKQAIYRAVKQRIAGNTADDYKEALAMLQPIADCPDANKLIHACQQKMEKILAADKKRAKRNKIMAVAILCIVAVVIVGIIVAKAFVLPNIQYNNAMALYNNEKFDEATQVFEKLGNYKDSPEKIKEIQYHQAEQLYEQNKYGKAAFAFNALGNYKDSSEKASAIWEKVTQREVISAYSATIGLKTDGTVVASGRNLLGECDVENWANIVSISNGANYTVGLKTDGTVVAVGYNYDSQCDVDNWSDIVSISAGERHTVGLKSDGTVVAVGNNSYGQCDVGDWIDIIAISAGYDHTVGLKADGTVVAVGNTKNGQCDVKSWADITAVSAGCFYTVGLKSDGTVVAVGSAKYGQCDVEDWTEIVSVSAGGFHTVGLKSDGTVITAGDNGKGQRNVITWTDIVAVSAGFSHTVGLKADGTVVAVGDNQSGQCDVEGWKDIKVPDK